MLREMIKDSLRGSRRSNRLESDRIFWALRDVDLEVNQGQCLGVCGSNGSGKTTLLRLLGRIYFTDEGDLEIGGSTSALLSLGAGIGHHLSGCENVFVVGALHGLKRAEIEERYDEIVAFAELDAATMRMPVRYYSSGMRSRLGFAIASTLSPEILLLDELLSVGDPAFRAKSADKLRELSNRARCVVISSHSIHFLKTHCDTALWLEKGRVMACGDAIPVLNEYKHFLNLS
jgi:ABC-type polysaccharide/polyol phosphate transport system ATPase subunit